jgi:UDP-glucose 4-epimerase
VHRFIFSSTAAVYGTPNHANPMKESDSPKPISPYGASKLAAETEVANFLSSPKKLGTSLRFFNVVGTESSELSDNSLANLVPIVINKINAYENPVIYGTNYPTEDGTCIRDYVDVRDIAAAVFAVSNCTSPLPIVMNIGTGQGASVRRVISVLANLANKSELGVVEESRRLGDPAILFANPSLIFEELNFKTKFTLEESLKSLTFSLLNS